MHISTRGEQRWIRLLVRRCSGREVAISSLLTFEPEISDLHRYGANQHQKVGHSERGKKKICMGVHLSDRDDHIDHQQVADRTCKKKKANSAKNLFKGYKIGSDLQHSKRMAAFPTPTACQQPTYKQDKRQNDGANELEFERVVGTEAQELVTNLWKNDDQICFGYAEVVRGDVVVVRVEELIEDVP